MSTFVRVIDERTAAIKGCGRACPDMNPLTRPEVPPSPPVSLLEVLRTHPDVAIDPEWLAAMETETTVH